MSIKTNPNKADLGGSNIFSEDFIDLFEQSVEFENQEGSIVQGRIIGIDHDSVYVDVGLKSEGRIAKKEFQFDGANVLQVGNEIEVYIEKYEARGGRTLLSREKALREKAWDKLKAVLERNDNIDGMIIGRVKGGFAVDLQGIVAFLPGSQVDVRPIKDISPLIDVMQPFKILKMDESQGNVVVSRKAILEESRAGERDKVLSEIVEGGTIEATVKNITDYGAFMDCGVFDGLLHITDISWEKISHPSEILSIGQRIKVVVTKFNPETKRVSLGLKQLQKNPWVGLIDKYKVGDKFKGTVTSVADYGAFVALEPGVEGLVYQTEIAYNIKNLNPRKLVKAGDEVEVKILDMDLDKQRIGLSIKQCKENPWEKFSATHPVGSKIGCTVKNTADFGIFVDIDWSSSEHKVEGLIPATELTWDSNYENELKKFKTGDSIEAILIQIDQDKERVTLSLKQMSEDFVKKAARDLESAESVMCVVKSVKKEGIEVMLGDYDIIAFIRKPDLSKHKSEQNTARFAIGEKVEAKVLGFDKETRRFNVSIKALEIEHEKEVIAKYGSTDSGASLGEILGDAIAARSKKNSGE